MTIRHHPREETLLAYAAGTLVPAISALVACHLALCPRCREEVRVMERIGGALLARLGDAPPGHDAATGRILERALSAAGELRRPSAARDGAPASALPRPLARHLGMELDDIPWKTLAPGVEQFKIKLARRGGDLRLLRVQPGRKLLRHGHYGSELTLVIEGAYADETGDYQAGEVADLDEDVEHRPRVIGEEPCLCIIAGETHPRYNSLKVRLLRPFLGI